VPRGENHFLVDFRSGSRGLRRRGWIVTGRWCVGLYRVPERSRVTVEAAFSLVRTGRLVGVSF